MAVIESDCDAVAPAHSPGRVQALIAGANTIIGKPYLYGGGHLSWAAPGYDGSGMTGYVLHSARLLSKPLSSEQFAVITQTDGFDWDARHHRWVPVVIHWAAGPGMWVSVLVCGTITHMRIAGLGLSAHSDNASGTNAWVHWRPISVDDTEIAAQPGGCTVRHPELSSNELQY
jgi:hypothetical protein